jgi:SNF2 family DNA or RNA helicase
MEFPNKKDVVYDSGKLAELMKLLYKIQAEGKKHKCLIFTQMSRMLDIIEAALSLHGMTYVRLDGATRTEKRQKVVDKFNFDERVFCFISSTRSGGIGLNLTSADTVIFYDTDWNPSHDLQAQDRCHRIGQTRDVRIYRLISEYTIEENILQKSRQKQELDQFIMEEGNFNVEAFKKVTRFSHDADFWFS